VNAAGVSRVSHVICVLGVSCVHDNACLQHHAIDLFIALTQPVFYHYMLFWGVYFSTKTVKFSPNVLTNINFLIVELVLVELCVATFTYSSIIVFNINNIVASMCPIWSNIGPLFAFLVQHCPILLITVVLVEIGKSNCLIDK